MKLLLPFLLVIGTIFNQCTPDNSVAGLSTELGNPVFTGLVLDSSLKPSTETKVTVNKIVNMSNSSLLSDMLSIEINSLKTDHEGLFSLYNIPSGDYLVRSFTNDSLQSVMKRIFITENIDSTVIAATIYDTLILGTPGSIKGVASRLGMQSNTGNQLIKDGKITIVIIEINQSTITGPDGIFTLSKVPQGIYSLAIYPDDNFFSEIRKSIQVKSGSITLIDTIKLQRIPWVKPPKPENLIYTYDTTSDSLKLQWNPVNIENLLGYIVERRVEEAILETERMFTKDTVFTESLTSYQTGSNLNYIVRAVTIQNEESYPEGPISIIVTH